MNNKIVSESERILELKIEIEAGIFINKPVLADFFKHHTWIAQLAYFESYCALCNQEVFKQYYAKL